MVFRRIILVLILGVLTTIVVAWGIVVRVRVYPRSGFGWPAGNASYVVAQGPIFGGGMCRVQEVARFSRPGRVTYISFAAFFTGMDPAARTDAGMSSSSFMPTWTHELLTIPPAPDPDPRTDPYYRAISVVGWPFQCLWHEMSSTLLAPGPVGAIEVLLPGWMNVNRAQLVGGLAIMPYRVRAVPFAANSAMFAAAWFGLLFGVRNIRRLRRRRRGACETCGYDMTGSPDAAVCPECGMTIVGDRLTDTNAADEALQVRG